jgi:hypothetical protein
MSSEGTLASNLKDKRARMLRDAKRRRELKPKEEPVQRYMGAWGAVNGTKKPNDDGKTIVF